MRRFLLATLFFVVLIAIWHFLVKSGRYSPVILPSPQSVGDGFARTGSPSAYSPFLIFDSIRAAAMRGGMSARGQRDTRQSLARLALVRRIGTKMI